MPLVPVEPAQHGADPAPGAPASTWPSRCWLVLAALLLVAAASACAGNSVTNRPAAASSEPRSFALYALSRGKGVPEDARAALARAESVLEDLQARGDVTVTKERIGLEGETRLCASFADGSLAERMLERFRRLVAGVDLVNLAEEPCDASARR